MTDLAPNMISSTFYQSGLLKLPKRKKERGPPIVQVIEVFRSQQPILNKNNNKSISISDKYNTNSFNKGYKNAPSNNQQMNKSITSNNIISRNYKGSQQFNNQNIKVNVRENKPNDTSNKSYNYNVNNINRSNNISSYSNNLSENLFNSNNSINIKKNNIINTRGNNNNFISSSYNISQNTYSRDNNYSSNRRNKTNNQDNNSPSRKIETNYGENKSIKYM